MTVFRRDGKTPDQAKRELDRWFAAFLWLMLAFMSMVVGSWFLWG